MIGRRVHLVAVALAVASLLLVTAVLGFAPAPAAAPSTVPPAAPAGPVPPVELHPAPLIGDTGLRLIHTAPLIPPGKAVHMRSAPIRHLAAAHQESS